MPSDVENFLEWRSRPGGSIWLPPIFGIMDQEILKAVYTELNRAVDEYHAKANHK